MKTKLFLLITVVAVFTVVSFAQAQSSNAYAPAVSITGQSGQSNGATIWSPSGNTGASAGNETGGKFLGRGDGPLSGETGSQGTSTANSTENPDGSQAKSAGKTTGDSFATIAKPDACEPAKTKVAVTGDGGENNQSVLNANTGSSDGGTFQYGAESNRNVKGGGGSTGTSSATQGANMATSSANNTTKSYANNGGGH